MNMQHFANCLGCAISEDFKFLLNIFTVKYFENISFFQKESAIDI